MRPSPLTLSSVAVAAAATELFLMLVWKAQEMKNLGRAAEVK
jgi:hypothetical protein